MSVLRLWTVATAITGLVAALPVSAIGGAGRIGPSREEGVDVSLYWTAPGDDDNSGVATGYDLRYSRYPISEFNFSAAHRYLGVPKPASAGNLQFCVVSGLLSNTDYYFALKAVDEWGNWSGISNVAIHTASLVGVEGADGPIAFSAPIPNPARNAATFAFRLTAPGFVSVAVFDVGGRRLRTLLGEDRPAGPGQLAWDLRDDAGHPVAAGLYLVRAGIAGHPFTRRIMVVR